MKGRVARIILAVGLPITAAVCGFSQAAGPEQYRAVVTQYCISCHNERTKTAGLMLDKLDFTNVAANGEIWEKAVRKLRVGMMPPQGAPQPDEATRRGLVSWLTTELDRG